MNEQLQNYIKQMKDLGKTDEEIKVALRNVGWRKEQINTEFPAEIKEVETSAEKIQKPEEPYVSEELKAISEAEEVMENGDGFLDKLKSKKVLIGVVIFFVFTGGAFAALYMKAWNPLSSKEKSQEIVQDNKNEALVENNDNNSSEIKESTNIRDIINLERSLLNSEEVPDGYELDVFSEKEKAEAGFPNNPGLFSNIEMGVFYNDADTSKMEVVYAVFYKKPPSEDIWYSSDLSVVVVRYDSKESLESELIKISKSSDQRTVFLKNNEVLVTVFSDNQTSEEEKVWLQVVETLENKFSLVML